MEKKVDIKARVPLHRPYRWAAADFQLGLRAIREQNWIKIDADHAERMQEKCERLNQHQPFYYHALAESLPAQQELVGRVTANLLEHHADFFEIVGSCIRSRITGRTLDPDDASTEPLLQLSQFIEEDFMLLDETNGQLRITAAANVYSSSGRLVKSVGHNMEWAHEYVPGLNDKLGKMINRVIKSVHPSTPCERFNWQLTPIANVFFPHHDPHAANAAAMLDIVDKVRLDPALAGEFLWMRVERQTLCRLAESNTVAFSLHTYSDPLACLEADLESVSAILKLLNEYSEARWKYSEMDLIREPLIAWLESAVSRARAH